MPDHLPGLTVWPKVIWGTFTGVAVGSTRFSDTHRLMLTRVQVTHISTVVTIVTWDKKDQKGSILPSPGTIFRPTHFQSLPSTLSIIPASYGYEV